MHKFNWFNLIFSITFFAACSNTQPELDNFNTAVWKEDRYACANRRSVMTESLLVQKEKLLSLDELKIIEMLGRPDYNELFKRNQKFYYYFLEPSLRNCGNKGIKSSKKIAIRFNAMGLAKEVTIE